MVIYKGSSIYILSLCGFNVKAVSFTKSPKMTNCHVSLPEGHLDPLSVVLSYLSWNVLIAVTNGESLNYIRVKLNVIVFYQVL